MSKQLADDPSGCPAEVTLYFLAGKWRPMIIYWLLQGNPPYPVENAQEDGGRRAGDPP
jgi:DNA-binding HxlR family transcriptional regulator